MSDMAWHAFWPEGIGARAGYRAEQTVEQRFGERIAVATIERAVAGARWRGFVHVYPSADAPVPCRVERAQLSADDDEARAQAEALLRSTVEAVEMEAMPCAG